MSLKPNQDSVFNFPHSLSLPDADSFFFFLIFNWRRNALHCYVRFCHVSA